ncbi:MAG TPA: acyl-CoA dehydratase activase [Methylomusa anaerophila]|uniref:R-phenyllactate dehydratase activator n=1 Tax=Methylomusa anaerophila TaxID=1930071 RepID=A0A348AQR5_9FIRM|nr:acyl-CoA dehydratase activase [Methylomusa anaerophila]BBB93413.1 R-phenyllactate dehydratase activator [Methylomusa anaerophila]HML90667.1 acyl-CoA dehydratase activase [Methylomusa anaerophila]
MENITRENFFEGLEIGSVSVKWVRRTSSGKHFMGITRHEGNPKEKVQEIFKLYSTEEKVKMVVTGQAAKEVLDLPYRSETECLEKALAHFALKPDILLSLGGEVFSIYTLKNGRIRNIIPSSKCAAGTGEFIVQQFQRMDLTLESGIQESRKGKLVDLATRCSVYCKSDATHKLNKGECSRSDIAKSLINDLAKKVYKMVELAQWESKSIVVIGGLTLNEPFIEHLGELFKDSELKVLDESPCFEAFGASLFAAGLSPQEAVYYSSIGFKEAIEPYGILNPLREAEKLLDYRAMGRHSQEIIAGADYIMGIDAGSTTTKAILFNQSRGTVDAGCYLRTHGNPVTAVKNCLQKLIEQVDDKEINVVQIAVTGSGRGIVSVFFENCPSFNEILAHARAAVMEVPDVDTVFEIGGQDSKFISFLKGIPVDYAMNDGCSAGTGSFLEESVSVDMGISVSEISNRAESSLQPVGFGERCAAFINTDLRNALQHGVPQEDVIAGLVYSIIRNYISRIVGVRAVGDKLLFQGGVALNKSVALAIAALTQRKVVVPKYPELMGCVGSCLMAQDMINEGYLLPKTYDLKELFKGTMEVKGTFKCPACENICEIKKIKVRGKEIPFGGLCSKYEVKHRQKQFKNEGQDLTVIRNQMMFEKYGAETLLHPRGTIGIPQALSTFELYPFYAKLINELGFNVVLSKISKEGNSKTRGSICYPCEIAHGAVYDLLNQGVDYIFLPHVVDGGNPDYSLHSYICPSATVIPDLIRIAFNIDSGRLLHPVIGFSDELKETSLKQIQKLGEQLGFNKRNALKIGERAFTHYESYKREFMQFSRENLHEILAEPTVILAGRPYIFGSAEANLALPRKITSRGYNVIPVDMLPQLENKGYYHGNVWRFTQQIENAVAYVKKHPNVYICMVSCFSCVPDASMYHIFRREMAGEIFCYLEIDSQTAHAGFETRVGAFLDIVELKERQMAGVS